MNWEKVNEFVVAAIDVVGAARWIIYFEDKEGNQEKGREAALLELRLKLEAFDRIAKRNEQLIAGEITE